VGPDVERPERRFRDRRAREAGRNGCEDVPAVAGGADFVSARVGNYMANTYVGSTVLLDQLWVR
jgi:hypothetical protein